MTTEQALLIAQEFQERAEQLGDRAGEGVRLARASSLIRDLCGQIDALTPAPVEPTPAVEDVPPPAEVAPPDDVPDDPAPRRRHRG